MNKNLKLIMMVGIPASGKTTEAMKLLGKPENKGMVRISLDDMRVLLTGKEYFFPAEGFIRASAEFMGRYLLSQGVSVLVDATSLHKSLRKTWIGLARQCNAQAHCYVVDGDIDECLIRNRKRARYVPDDVIVKMSHDMEWPDADEGFDSIMKMNYHRSTHSGAIETIFCEAGTNLNQLISNYE